MGKVAVVTGAGSGIGRAVAQALLGAGWQVALVGRRNEALEESAAGASPGAVLTVPADICDPDAVAEVFSRTQEQFGSVDLLFNNAGSFGGGKPIEDFDLDIWRSVVNVNLNGAFYCAQAAYRVMKAQNPQGGRIINNGSVSAHVPRPNAIAYTASKHAVTGLTRAIALEGRQFNISCGQIDIGNVATSLAHGLTSGTLQANGTMAVEPVMDMSSVVDAVVYMAGLPLNANVLTMTVMANGMPYVGRG